MFQRTMDVVPSAVMWQLALAYVDNIFIFSCSAAEHVDHDKYKLTLLRDTWVTLNLERRKLLTVSIDYFLGHVVRAMLLDIVSHTTDAIKEHNFSRVVEVNSFVGLCNVVR